MKLLTALALTALLVNPGLDLSGRLAVWDGLGPRPVPAGNFVYLAAGGATQTLAIKADGTLYLSPHAMAQITQPSEEFSRGPYVAAGMGRNHLLAIRLNGTIATHPYDSAAPTTGSFKAVTGGNTHSVALHTDGRVTVWGSGPAVAAGAPAGMLFDAIAARGSYTLALGKDGNIYGWGANPIFSTSFGWSSDQAGNHFIAPREVGRSYTKVAAGLSPVMGQGLIAALRDDGRIVMWDSIIDSSMKVAPPPTDVTFKDVALGLGYGVGIDVQGLLHAWSDNARAGFVANTPEGVYSMVSAATSHATAIEATPLTSAGPAEVWLGLKNSDDVGTKFDLLAEVLHNGNVIATGQLNSVPGGSSGFNNAALRGINLVLTSPLYLNPGEILSLKLSVRIATAVSGHRSGTARLWFNDAAANSRLTVTVDGAQVEFYLVGSSAATYSLQGGETGAGPRKTIDVFVDKAVGGNPFKPLGTWSMMVQ